MLHVMHMLLQDQHHSSQLAPASESSLQLLHAALYFQLLASNHLCLVATTAAAGPAPQQPAGASV
jgi:hypothetical protein